MEAMRRPEEVTPELRAYRALWRNMRGNPELKEHIQLAWSMILPKLKSGVTADEIDDVLSGVLDSEYQIPSFEVVQAYTDGQRLAEDCT
jgi:hypothetical protein